MVRILEVTVAPALLALAALACACADGGRQCNVGGDCASGACSADGMCVAQAQDAGSGTDVRSDTQKADAAMTSETSVSTDGSCATSDGGAILRSQVVLMAGLHATFRIAENVTVSTAGETLPDGARSWDFSGALTGDHDVLVETLPLSGTWYASAFAGASYSSQLSDTSSLLGVFDVTASDLLLQGVVSPDGGFTETELTYKPAVTTLQFPLMQGATWSTKSSVSGKAEGVLSDYTEDYTSSVDLEGSLKTPLATFHVLRVGTVLTRTVGIVKTVIRSYVFITDCYGPVAAITSKNNETSAEFTSASEIRRIAP
jgi:hypothetical protein